ncbi:hypothetical protein A5893_13505 [Pedobacter psychrophilus]|uniref:Glycosyltransferase subfamily 4-like N-terminal domain-containing protein n=1 Tax=Pedobacter psychrophilus TaxID=1826909 RepID=A0A179DCK9_9SPHI|nr:hypothetical protein [Pedobacter psychrophilus]OAQ38440.1 hypothetical protein A5893_13505 [Pedobacter psychrophilus]
MKIGIIEICEANHYTAVEALAITYSLKSENQVCIYTLKSLKIPLSFSQKNIEIAFDNSGELIEDYLKRIDNDGFDQIHINTISKYYKEFASVNWQSKVVLTVHNIDAYFDNSFDKQIDLLKYRLNRASIQKIKTSFYLPIKYFFKELKRQKQRDLIIKNLKAKGDKVLIYSDAQKVYLQKFIDASKVIVFPFCIHQSSKDLSQTNQKLRICIPGSVDNERRDYVGFFEVLKQNISFLKGKIAIDLLGYIPKNNQFLIPLIKELEILGIQFFYQANFLKADEFELRLNTCDIILGNLKVNLNNQSKYGETKETGVIFNMIKAAKPGIFPSDYIVPEDLKEICLNYDEDIYPILKNLIEDNSLVKDLKEKAKLAVKAYEPENLYQKLVQD